MRSPYSVASPTVARYRYGSEVTKITFTLQGKTKIGGK